MAAHICVDRIDAGIRVSIFRGFRKVEKVFAARDEAERFAIENVGKRGVILSTLDMTPEQLARHNEREARTAAALEVLRAQREAGR